MRCATPSATSPLSGVSAGEVMSAMLARVAITVPEVSTEGYDITSEPCAIIIASVHQLPQSKSTITPTAVAPEVPSSCEGSEEVISNTPTTEVFLTGKQTVVTPTRMATGINCPTCGSPTGTVCPTCLGAGSVSRITNETSIPTAAPVSDTTQFTQVPISTLTGALSYGPTTHAFSARAVEEARRAANESFISKAAEYLRQNFAGRTIEEVALCTEDNLRRAVSHQPMIYTEEVARRHRNLNNFLEPKASEGIAPSATGFEPAASANATTEVTPVDPDAKALEDILALLK